MNRTPRYVYKIRKATTNNKTGDNFVITIPQNVASQFENVDMFMSVTDTSIILESGCKVMSKKEER
ncbi:MAG: hypothetical protein Q7R52_01840 [archaeon]|nr:hypothetical protein [archaeon]